MNERIFEYREEFNITDIARKYAERVSRVIDEQTLANVEHQLAGYGYIKVVRCRDCKHRYACGSFMFCELRRPDEPVDADGYCAWAERKEGGE